MNASTRKHAHRLRLGTAFTIRELAGARGASTPSLSLNDLLCIGVAPTSGCDGNRRCFELLTYNAKLTGQVPLLPDTQIKNRPRAKEMIPHLARADCDALALQEVYVPAMRNLLLKGPTQGLLRRREGGLLNAHQYADHRAKNGLLIISKWPIGHHRWFPFSRNPGGRKRGVLYTRIDRQGISYHVFNTHLWWDKNWDQNCRAYRDHQLVRQEQLREIESFIDGERIPTGEPIFVVGDFNFGGPEDARYQKCCRTSDGSRHPECAERDVHGYDYLKNHVLQATDLYEYPPNPSKRILDHIFYRNADFAHCRSAIERLRFTTDIQWEKSPDLSDHHPYKGHFEFA